MTNVVNFRPDSRTTSGTAVAPPPGSLSRRESIDFDVYTGRGADLVSAGLAAFHELPGKPGRPKCTATYLPNGSAAQGGRVQSWRITTGGRRIERTGADRFEVCVVVPDLVRQRRLAQFQAIFAHAREAHRPKTFDEHLDRLQQLEVERQHRVVLRLRRRHLAVVHSAERPA